MPNRLPRMGHKSAPPRFSSLVRCLKTLRAHSRETARWQPREAGHADSESDTAYDSEGSRSDDRWWLLLMSLRYPDYTVSVLYSVEMGCKLDLR